MYYFCRCLLFLKVKLQWWFILLNLLRRKATPFTSRPKTTIIWSTKRLSWQNSAFCSISIRVLCQVFQLDHKVDRLPMVSKIETIWKFEEASKRTTYFNEIMHYWHDVSKQIRFRGVNTRVIYPTKTSSSSCLLQLDLVKKTSRRNKKKREKRRRTARKKLEEMEINEKQVDQMCFV